MSELRRGYNFPENKGMASNVPLSSDASFYQRIARERAERRSGNNLEELLEDLKKSAEKGECNWATREPVY